MSSPSMRSVTRYQVVKVVMCRIEMNGSVFVMVTNVLYSHLHGCGFFRTSIHNGTVYAHFTSLYGTCNTVPSCGELSYAPSGGRSIICRNGVHLCILCTPF